MKKVNRSYKVGKVQAGVFSLLLIFCLTIPSYSWVDSSVFRIESEELTGASDPNNIAFAFGRYILTAPFAPSKEVKEDTLLTELDNHYLYLLDAKKINSEPIKFDLGCYYPTRVFYDPGAKTVFVKGTEFVEEDGAYLSYAVIKYLRLDLTENGKLNINDAAQTIRIPGVKEEIAEVAPDEFVISQEDGTFIFTNGASAFTYSLAEGFLYKVDFITAKDFNPETNCITHLGFDSASRVFTVLINKKEETDQQWKQNSELYIYSLAKDGTLDLLNTLAPEALPDGVCIPAGSDIAIDSEDGKAGKVYFAGNDGVVYQTSWTTDEGDLSGSVEALTPPIEELRQSDGQYFSSVNTDYNKQTRVFKLLKNGYTAYINRPLNAGGRRIGKINRPLNLRFEVESPALVLAQLGKKNKLTLKAFSAEIAEQGGVSMFSDNSETQYVATFKGNVYELNMAQGVDNATLDLLGQIGNRLSNVAYLGDRKVFVGINSVEFDGEGETIATPGFIHIAKRREENSFLSFVNWTENSWLLNPVLGVGISSIRRPCNFRLR
jgi:hypothetical protein